MEVRALKYDSYDDYIYFIMGASIASGRIFWVGEDGKTNKGLKDTDISTSLSRDGRVITISQRGRSS
jgi:hypothetical protein